MGKPTVEIRQATPGDLIFVHSSWHTSYWKATAIKQMDRETYLAHQDSLIDRLLHESRTLVAFTPEVPDEVLGWVAREGSTLHFVYVKSTYRGNGIGKGLVQGCKSYTQWMGTLGQRFAQKHALRFNPYLTLAGR